MTLALFFSGLLTFLTPLPLIYLALKIQGDWRREVTPILVMFVLVGLVYFLGLDKITQLYRSSPLWILLVPLPLAGWVEFFPIQFVATSGAVYFCFLLLSALLIGQLFIEPESVFSRALVLLGIVVLAVFSIYVAVYQADATAFFGVYREQMTQALDEFLAQQANNGSGVSEMLDLKDRVPEMVSYTVFLLPSFVVMSLGFLILVNIVVAKRAFAPFFPDLQKLDLTIFSVPFLGVWAVIVLVALSLLSLVATGNMPLNFLVINLLVVMAGVYFVQGLAVMVHFMNKKGVVGLWRVLVYLMLLIFIQPFLLIMTVLGFFDSWLDVRKLDAGTSGSGKPQAQT